MTDIEDDYYYLFIFSSYFNVVVVFCTADFYHFEGFKAHLGFFCGANID